MIAKSITYTDFNGEEQTDVFYFNMTEAELIELNLSEADGFEEHFKNIMRSRDNREIHAQFVAIIKKSYGEKSRDGRFFNKIAADGVTPLVNAFMATPAYSKLIMEMFTDTEALSAFVVGMMPADLAEKSGLTGAKSPEDIRAASLAAKGGYQKKQDKPQPSMQHVPDLPSEPRVGQQGEQLITQTAAPSFAEDTPKTESVRDEIVRVQEEKRQAASPDMTNMTDSQIAEMVRNGGITLGNQNTI